MKTLFTFLFLLLAVCPLPAQPKADWELYLEHVVALDDMEAASWEEVHQVLNEYALHPININEATEDDLRQLLFLNDRQIDELLTYLGKYRGMRTLAELNLLRELDYNRKMLLSCLVYAGDMPQHKPSIGQLLRNGKQEVVFTAGIPLYRREGFANGRYQGGPLRHWLRYDLNAQNQLRLGLVGAQDAGEPFFKGGNRLGYDYHSFYFQLRRRGLVDNLVVGRYKVRAGMGLVINGGLGLGKATFLANLGGMGNAVTVHSSRSEANYLQGMAVTLQPRSGLQLTPFLSYRRLDGTFNNDSTTLYNIASGGYHRTVKELDRKNNTSMLTSGLLFRVLKNGFHLGATLVYNKLDRALRPMKTDSLGTIRPSQLYRMWLPQGTDFWNVGLNYGYNHGRLSLHGETARGNCKAWAALHTLNYAFSGSLSLTALHRFYSYRYYALQSMSYSEGGSTQNESGLYVGVNWRIRKYLQLTSYVDYAYFPWPKYQTLGSSHAWDCQAGLLYQRRSWSAQLRYRYRRRQRDDDGKTRLIPKQEHRGQAMLAYAAGGWTVTTKASINYSLFKRKGLGCLLEQKAGYRGRNFRVTADIGYFHTSNYDSRVYTYERTLLYMMSIPSFSGQGLRYGLLADWQLGRLRLGARFTTTDYFDRASISTGLQRIDGSSQADVDVQLRYSF